ncbi:hypothetical protein RRG08_036356 [Elysia crispata]|uniref:Uncharacterized protein n=1 Tax=Elysia crispata TaxID=231223 RepID=A0AAE0ZJS8_9GAST|nr:hypothetical protein RRG08_036356 [Elysia crispata]
MWKKNRKCQSKDAYKWAVEKHLTEGRKEYQGQATQGLTTHFSPSRESAYTIALDLKTFLPYPLPGEGMSSGKPQTPASATARALGPGSKVVETTRKDFGLPETMETEIGILALTLGRVIECKNTRCKSDQGTEMRRM